MFAQASLRRIKSAIKPFQRKRKQQSSQVELLATDVVISSYPRSGNTWTRLLIADVLEQLHGFETSTTLPVHQNNVIPFVDCGKEIRFDDRIQLPFRLFKSHLPHWTHVRKAIVLFRRPASSLCSYYHYHLRDEKLRHLATDNVNQFCRVRLDEWTKHIVSFLGAVERNQIAAHWVSYEALYANPVECLQQMISFLGLNADTEICRRSVENHRFEKHQALQNANDANGERFFRQGEIDSAKRELDAETYNWINEQAMTFYENGVRLVA